jgi:hypothetical protein
VNPPLDVDVGGLEKHRPTASAATASAASKDFSTIRKRANPAIFTVREDLASKAHVDLDSRIDMKIPTTMAAATVV